MTSPAVGHTLSIKSGDSYLQLDRLQGTVVTSACIEPPATLNLS